MTTEDNRQATLKELHQIVAHTADTGLGLAHAVVMMAVRYGAARVLEGQALEGRREFHYELISRARMRRFSALQRLVSALDRKS